jgi:hypothetical protein
MSTELAKAAATGIAAFTGGANPFTKAADHAGVSTGAQRLNFNGRNGGWFIGREALEDGTELAFDMLGAKWVWTAWKGKRPVETLTYSILDGETPPPEETLVNHWIDGKKNTDGWAKGIIVKVINPENGETYETTLKAETPYRPVMRLLREFGEKMKANLDDNGDFMVPLIEIGTTDFETKSGDVVYAPVLELIGWATREELDTVTEASARAEAGDLGSYEEETQAAKKAAPAASTKPALRIGKRV